MGGQVEYVRGCYNKIGILYVELISGEQLYKVAEKTPSYKYGKLLLSLDKKDEFIKLLNSFEEPSNDIWSIYDQEKYEMLALAYQNGIGRETNDKLAVLNAFRGRNLALISSFIELGYGKNTLKNPEFFIEELEGISSNAHYIGYNHKLLKELVVEAANNNDDFAKKLLN